jgi:hypothetical protein
MIAAAAFDNNEDFATLTDVQCSVLEQEAVNRRIKQAVVNDIVHMPVDVVVGPSCPNYPENLVCGTLAWAATFAHHQAAL